MTGITIFNLLMIGLIIDTKILECKQKRLDFQIRSNNKF